MLPTKFQVNGPFGSGEEEEEEEEKGFLTLMAAILGFPIGTILATFDLQVTLILPTKFRSFKVNWLFGS